ncbi:MAG: hypothetical protein JWM16_1305 [Verrucomicrobiales bacterium]|nr:hypothetical protein [Verrucomicrobiales bacterium]
MPKASFWGKIVAVSISISFSAQADIVVHESIKDVRFSVGKEQPIGPISSGAVIGQAGVLETGEDGLAEITANHATLRMGSKTAVRLQGGEKLELLRGNLLFGSIPQQQPLSAVFGGSTVVLSGEAGFVQCKDKTAHAQASVMVGSMSGATVIKFSGKAHIVRAGEFMAFASDGSFGRGYFDLEKQMAESRLINGFSTPLPGLRKMQKEAVRFAQLRKRGFIQHVEQPAAFGSADQNRFLLAAAQTIKENTIGFSAPTMVATPVPVGNPAPSPSGSYYGSTITMVSQHGSQLGQIPPLPPMPPTFGKPPGAAGPPRRGF